MSRPELSIRNFEELYAGYMEQEISPVVARLGHFVSDLAYRTDGHVHISEAAEQAIQDARNDETGNKRLLLAGNHLAMTDPFALAAALRSQESLQFMMTNTSIIGKHTLFSNFVTRYLLDEIGAIPAFLSRRTAEHFANPEEHAMYQKGAASALGDVAVKRMVQDGNHLVMYAEVGGRNRENPHEVQPLHLGIGHIAIDASQYVDLDILPVGLVYPGAKLLDYRRPEIVIGDPIPASEFTQPETVVTVLRPAIQDVVDEAFDYAEAA